MSQIIKQTLITGFIKIKIQIKDYIIKQKHNTKKNGIKSKINKNYKINHLQIKTLY